MSQPMTGSSKARAESPAPAKSMSRPRASRSRGRNRSRSASALRGEVDDMQDTASSSTAASGKNPRRRGKRDDGALASIQEITNDSMELQKLPAQGTLGGGIAMDSMDHDEDDGLDQVLQLRLEINLEIEINLKARIHGDLTLAIL